MKENQTYTVRRNILQVWAIALAFCYLFAPLKDEVISVLHNISHHFERPTNIISHSSTAGDFHWEGVDTESKSNHSHSVLTLLSEFLNGSEPDNDGPISKELKIDKHLPKSNTAYLNTIKLVKDVNRYPQFLNSKPVGYVNEINPPPDIFQI